MLKREVEQSLQERDKAMRESHDLRYDIGFPQTNMNINIQDSKSN